MGGQVMDRCARHNIDFVFIESICNDQAIIDANIRETKLRSPDYQDMDHDKAIADFRARIKHYEVSYEPIDEDVPYIKVIDVGKQMIVNQARGDVIQFDVCDGLILAGSWVPAWTHHVLPVEPSHEPPTHLLDTAWRKHLQCSRTYRWRLRPQPSSMCILLLSASPQCVDIDTMFLLQGRTICNAVGPFH